MTPGGGSALNSPELPLLHIDPSSGSGRGTPTGTDSRLTFDLARRPTVVIVDGYRISQLAERVGVPATTLRYYEAQGLLPARRTAAGYRVYDDTDVERVRFLVTAKSLGLPLSRIRDLLRVWHEGMCRDVRDERTPLLHDRIVEAGHRITELEAFRDHLTEALARLDALPARDTPCDPTCAFLGATTPAEPVVGPPVACTLDPAEYGDRAARWRAALSGSTREPLPDGGLRVRVSAERADEVAALVAAEARCCPFLTLRRTVAAGAVELDAHAPAEAAGLLRELFTAEEAGSAC